MYKFRLQKIQTFQFLQKVSLQLMRKIENGFIVE